MDELSSPPPFAIDMARELSAQSDAADSKAERTRLRLLASAAALLDTLPLTQMRPTDLAEHAGVSRGLIYHHFKDMADLVTQLMLVFEQRLVGDLLSIMPDHSHADYRSMVNYLAWTLHAFQHNLGLMRLLLTHADSVSGVEAIVERILHAFNQRLGDAILPPEGLEWTDSERLQAGYLVGGGVSDLLWRILRPGHHGIPMPQTADAMFDLVQLMALMRHREIHGCDPTKAEILGVAEAFDRSIFADCMQQAPLPESASTARRPSAPRLRRMAATTTD